MYVIKTLSKPKGKGLSETEGSKSGKVADFVLLLPFHAPPYIMRGKRWTVVSFSFQLSS